MLWRKANHHAAIQHFSYDDEQRVSAITFEGHSEFERIEFCYDIFGRRREKRVYRHGQDTPEIIEFFWTGAKMTGECSSARPGEMTQYHYSEDSWEPIARTDSTEYGENTYWYHCGLNGLPTEMTNASGKVVWRGEENLWGEISHEISHFSANAVQQNLRFQGQYLDRETGLHYNLFRYYDPVARRFTQPDPIGLMGGINTYQYAPNALAWVDPLGLTGKPLNSPDMSKWLDKGGNIWQEVDGRTWGYQDWNNNIVRYPDGYPDFTPYQRQHVDITDLKSDHTKAKTGDFGKADAHAPLGQADYVVNTWHHHQNGTTMQEVPRNIHRRFTHRGGVSNIKKKCEIK